MWPESEGRRGSNEVATCLLKYTEIQSHQGVRDITMFSDNCAGQNRNRFVAFALNFARTHFKLETITHTFLEKGHTETENDSVHATSERKSRNIDIYSPEQSFTVARTARTSKQPYVVHEMTSGDFIDFKGMASQVRNHTTDDSGNKISWSNVRQVMSMANDPSALHIKTFYNGQP
ncbi:DNA repair protein rhp54 [Elysia marginata]|uniref:DNA repair protein rhp54 n=1 Tax=Elysia marginata TaxID=1093978 RepID=A0AAV4JJ51_9GAST|nr:DNA repair protein rhp54 [Elysia marginata]